MGVESAVWSAYVKVPGQHTHTLTCVNGLSVEDVCDAYGIPDYYVTCGGRLVGQKQALVPGTVYTICQRLRGGKGGFGSMLRAIGAQIEKTTNREACRDLSGRRMRDVNNEKKMLEYLEKKAEREREREKKKKDKLERLTRAPKHFFNDPEYESKLHEVVENVDKALEKGLKSHAKKRKVQPQKDQKEGPELKKGLWLGLQDDTDSDSDSDDEMYTAALRTSPPPPKEPSDSDAGPSCSKEDVHESEVNLSEMTKGESACVAEPDTSSERPVDDETTKDKNSNEPALIDEIMKVSEIDGSSEHKGQEEKATNINISQQMGTESRPDEPVASKRATIDGNSPQMETESRTDEPVASGSLCMDVTDKNISESLPNKPVSKTGSSRPTEGFEKEIDLSDCKTIEDLENLGLEALKSALMKKGVKCGGTLKERAVRLYNVKDLAPDQIDQSLLAKNAKKRNRSKK